MTLLNHHQAVGIIALSNGLSENQRQTIEQLEVVLTNLGLEVKYPTSLFRTNSVYHATDQERAQMLMDFYQDNHIQAIFDVSGGDLANGVLPYLDYDLIHSHSKLFFGYSDLSVVLNAIYAKTNQPTYLYQIRNLVGEKGLIQQQRFQETFLKGGNSLLELNPVWIQGNHMSGEVIGGNIRCFLKLAGTSYMPDFNEKILLLESYSGDVAKMATYLNQYKQLGVFDRINGIILGYFTEMQEKKYQPDIVSLVRQIVNNDKLPIVKTEYIGHGADSRCAIIGELLTLSRESEE
ncbi:MAG: S66 peptidase family protein [Turicibacter sp.]|nr:S66 peptidase family protein [Turicibacter sp.]